jgi:hypothetical protein
MSGIIANLVSAAQGSIKIKKTIKKNVGAIHELPLRFFDFYVNHSNQKRLDFSSFLF